MTLGKFAGQLLLDSEVGITKLRGQPYPYGDARAHPHVAPGLRPAGRRRAAGPDAGRLRPGQAGARAPAVRRGRRRDPAGPVPLGRRHPGRWPPPLAELARPGDLILLAGELAPARPPSPRASARPWASTEPITSPTFTLASQYEGRLDLNHLDVYRLEQLAEVLDVGLPEMLDEGGVTVVEWGDAIIAGAARRLPARAPHLRRRRRRPRRSRSSRSGPAGRPGRRALHAGAGRRGWWTARADPAASTRPPPR